jgi:hypothetical protein
MESAFPEIMTAELRAGNDISGITKVLTLLGLGLNGLLTRWLVPIECILRCGSKKDVEWVVSNFIIKSVEISDAFEVKNILGIALEVSEERLKDIVDCISGCADVSLVVRLYTYDNYNIDNTIMGILLLANDGKKLTHTGYNHCLNLWINKMADNQV